MALNNFSNTQVLWISPMLELICSVWPAYEAASWQLKTSGYEISQVKYSIFGEGLKEHQGYYFPEYAPTDQALYVGFKPIRFQRIFALAEALGSENKKIHAWKAEFESPIRCLDRVTFLYRRIYTRNISEYTIYIQSSRTEKWYKKRMKIPFKGYQIPSYDAISQWELIKKKQGRCAFSHPMLHIILSESMQAMEFVIALEEEFEIEFDDEDISIEFFLDLDHIVLSVLKGLAQKAADDLVQPSAVT